MGTNTVRFKFFKKDELKYLSHLDVLALMERALMRTGMPLFYSGGFHPKPKLSFSNPIPLGVQSLAEYCDIELLEAIPAEDFTVRLNSKLPDNLKVINALNFEKTPENKIPSLMSAIDVVIYEYELLYSGILSGEPGSREIFKKSSRDIENPETGQLVNGYYFPGSFLSSFEKDFGEKFGPTVKNEDCDADLQKIRNSILNYQTSATQDVPENIPGFAPKTQAAASEKITVAETFASASGPMENIFFLKICGYAKILKNSINTIFKFNAFNDYLEKFLETKDIEVRKVQKTGTYILKDNILTDPIEMISFKFS